MPAKLMKWFERDARRYTKHRQILAERFLDSHQPLTTDHGPLTNKNLCAEKTDPPPPHSTAGAPFRFAGDCRRAGAALARRFFVANALVAHGVVARRLV